MNAAIAIALKDLKQRIRDRSAILLAIVVPLGLTFIMAQTLSGVSGDSEIFDFGIVNEDGGELATTFRTELLDRLVEEKVISLTSADTVEAGRELAADGDVNATFVIPAGFTDAIMSNQPTAITVYGNADANISTSVAEAIASGYMDQLQAVQLSIAVAGAGLSDQQALAELAERATEFPNPIVMQDESASRKQLSIETYYAAGMAVLFLFFTVQFGVRGLIDERRGGTMARLLAAPVKKASIVGGKMGAAFVMGVFSMIVLVIGSTYLVGAEWGDYFGVALLVVAGVLAAISIMTFVASFASEPEAAENAQIVVAMLLGMLGGSFFPVTQAGGITETLSMATPHAWFLRGLGELQGGGTVADIWIPLLAMLAIAGITGVGAALRFGKLVRV